MADGTLVIGTRRYSSWSLRGWLVVRLAGLDVEERVIPLAGAGAPPRRSSRPRPPGWSRTWNTRAPMSGRAWRCANTAPRSRPALWPADRVARAAARSIAAEMHAGFRALRQAMPMNLGRERRLASLGGRRGRHRPDRGGLARGAAGHAVPLWRRVRRGGRDVCPRGRPLPVLPARTRQRLAGVLPGGAGASADGGVVRGPPPKSRQSGSWRITRPCHERCVRAGPCRRRRLGPGTAGGHLPAARLHADADGAAPRQGDRQPLHHAAARLPGADRAGRSRHPGSCCRTSSAATPGCTSSRSGSRTVRRRWTG